MRPQHQQKPNEIGAGLAHRLCRGGGGERQHGACARRGGFYCVLRVLAPGSAFWVRARTMWADPQIHSVSHSQHRHVITSSADPPVIHMHHAPGLLLHDEQHAGVCRPRDRAHSVKDASPSLSVHMLPFSSEYQEIDTTRIPVLIAEVCFVKREGLTKLLLNNPNKSNGNLLQVRAQEGSSISSRRTSISLIQHLTHFYQFRHL